MKGRNRRLSPGKSIELLEKKRCLIQFSPVKRSILKQIHADRRALGGVSSEDKACQ
jgi:hypothetical protein